MPSFNLPYFAKELKKIQDEIFFIQIGAMDGKTNDPIHELVKSQSWRGILVEPLKDHFETLKQNYADCAGLIFENVAIAEQSGTRKMYRIPTQTVHDGKLPRWGLEAGSFFSDRTALAWEEIKPHVVEETVTCLKLSDLISKHKVNRIDVLQLDAEGYDFQILRQFNFEKFRPHIIHLEIVNMTNAEIAHCKQLLDKHQYLYAKVGYNLLAVSLPAWFS